MFAFWHASAAVRHVDPVSEEDFVVYVCLVVFLVIVAGLMSGLTIGLLSMDQVDIEVRRTCM